MSSHDDASRSPAEPTAAPAQDAGSQDAGPQHAPQPAPSPTSDTATGAEATGVGPRQGTVFQLTRDLLSLPESLRLRNVEWGVLFAVTGEHTVAQISAHFGLEGAEQKAVFSRLLSEGLIAEREVSYGEYLHAAATIRDDEPKTLARFLRAGVTFGPVARTPRVSGRTPTSNQPVVGRAAGPTPGAAAAVARPAPPLQPPASELPEMHQTRAIPTFSREQLASFEPLGQPAEPQRAEKHPPATPAAPPAPLTTPAEPRQLSLKRVMQFILDRAPDLNAGQLDIYRVFIRVNTKLLRRNGINTLRFEEDRLIADPELQHAITASVEKTLGLTCPQDVYLAA